VKEMNIDRNELLNILHQNAKVEIVFIKVDETVRTMICTLKQGTYPTYVPSKNPRTTANDRVLPWDLEKEAFRTVILEKIVTIKILEV
jgi:hypothetical protein